MKNPNENDEEVSERSEDEMYSDPDYIEDGDSLRDSSIKISLSGDGSVNMSNLKVNDKAIDYKDNIKKPEVVENLTEEQLSKFIEHNDN